MNKKEARKLAKKFSVETEIACSTKDKAVATTASCVSYQIKNNNVDRVYINGKGYPLKSPLVKSLRKGILSIALKAG